MDTRPGSGPGPRRPWPGRARAAAALASIAAVTLLAAACGGGSAGAGVTTAARSQEAQAFASCMRSHGVPDFPSPSSDGHFLTVHVHESPGTVASAQAACQHLLPGSAGTAAQQPHQADNTGPAQQTAGQPPPCAPPAGSPPPVRPTTVTTIEQAYYCVLTNYYAGPVLHDQVLLIGAFAGFTQELDRLGADQPDATLPRLTGSHGSDWAAFAAVYQRVIRQVPASAAHRQALAAATINGMIASLNDNHARWDHLQWPPGFVRSDDYGLGITTSPSDTLTSDAPQEALPPLFVTAVDPGSPAAGAGVRPGDVIVSVDGAASFAGGLVSPGVMNLLFALYPQARTVSLRLRRPATGRTWTVTVTPAMYYVAARTASARLLGGDIAYVKLPSFFPGAADQVLHEISALGKATTLHGVILDLRGNSGGAPPEVARLLGAFVHGAAWSYDCDVRDSCTPNYTDGSVPLLHLPLVVLTDRNCASACDAFTGAVKDLRVGALVGTRTSGLVAGPASGFVLDDGSLLSLPAEHELGASHETINGIGVAPGYYVPLTAQDLSTGHDPDVAKALTLLGR
jgi:carboxyl-terminal processing protease